MATITPYAFDTMQDVATAFGTIRLAPCEDA